MEGEYDSGRIVDEYLNIFKKDVLNIILKEEIDTRKFMVFIGSLNKFFEDKNIGRIIVVGGFAVEIYTGRGYRTADIDIITEGYGSDTLTDKILRKLGYDKEGRTYIIETGELLSKAVDIVGILYDKPKQPIKWMLDKKDYYFYIIPPEEAIVSSLASAKFWNIGIDYERAAMIYVAQKDNMDIEYLLRRADKENVRDFLDKIVKMIQ